MEKVNEAEETVHSTETELPPKSPDAGLINASGHRQELDRNFGLIHICGLGITTGNTWMALGGSLVCKFYSSVAWEVLLMVLRLSQFTMEDPRVSFTNCTFSTLLSVVLSSNMV
jgi:choline transport protein